METKDKLKLIKIFLKSKGVRTSSKDLTVLQRHFFNVTKARPLVGTRKVTGGYTADTWIYRMEKSTAGVLYFDRVFSPYSFDTYDEALLTSLIQAVENI